MLFTCCAVSFGCVRCPVCRVVWCLCAVLGLIAVRFVWRCAALGQCSSGPVFLGLLSGAVLCFVLWCCGLLCRSACVVLPCALLLRLRLFGVGWCLVLLAVLGCLLEGLSAWCCLLVACVGAGVPIWPHGRLPCCLVFWCGLLWCRTPRCCVLWCCAAVWCCAVRLCCLASFVAGFCFCSFL